MQGWNEKGYYYARSSYSLNKTHGGHEAEHKEEIETIANDIFDQRQQMIIDLIAEQTYNRAINALLQALKVDINSIVSVGLSNAGDIFYGERCQTAIMQAIYNEIANNLKTDYKLW